MKKLLLLIMLLSVAAKIFAYDTIEVNGVYYYLKEGHAIVTYKDSNYNSYSGTVVIPNSVTYKGKTYSVTSIGESAFRGCTSLTSITIPNSVTRIGDGAFYACRSLTSINIPNGVTSIGGNAFIDTRLTSVTIPSSVTSIGGAAFCVNPNLTSINVDEDNPIYDSRDNCNAIIETATNTLISGCNNTVIPNSVTSIPDNAFYGSGVTSIVIPGSVTSIGTNAFGYCDNLTSITLSEGLTSIARNAFMKCLSLESICIPESVTSIGDGILGPHPNLTSISVKEGNLFYDSRGDCNAIIETGTNTIILGCQNTIIPNDVVCIKDGTFEGCNFTSFTIPDNVTSIGYCAFLGCDNLNSVTIGSGVTNISREAFRDCSSLTSITIPDNVTGIGFSAFMGCSSLNAITIGSGITSIEECAFHECNSLTDVYCYAEVLPTIYNWIENNEIGTNAFGDTPIGSATLHVPAASLQAYSTTAPWSNFGTIVAIEEDQNIAFADANVKAICVDATTNWDTNGDGELSEAEAAAVTDLGTVFKENNEITSFNELQYFTGLTSISNNAFQGCSSLTFITIPSSISRIGTYAFSDCVSLTSVTLPNSVTSIGGYAFYNCMNLKSVMMPASIITFEGYLAFGENNNIESVYITDLTKWLGIDFRNNNPLRSGAKLYLNNVEVKDLVIPDGTTSILEAAFEGCESLTSVTIPSSVTSISNWSFASNNNLATVTIAEGVTSIGDCVFKACSSLTDVWCYAENIPITGDRLFTDTPIASATLHVPAASLQVYSTTAPWNGFGTIVAIEGASKEMLYAEDATVNRGATFELPIHMDNGDEEITAFSFDVEVPAGVTILSATLSERKADQTNPVPTLKSDGSYGLATLSVSNANFSGSEGTLLTLTVKVNANVTPGNYTIKLKNIELSTISNPIELPYCTSTLTVLDVMTGDVNGDGKVSIFDAVQIINYILENDPDPFIFSAADLDGNGKITIFDAVSVVNIILTQSSSNNVKEMLFIDELDPQ